jgi:hypothetical protein
MAVLGTPWQLRKLASHSAFFGVCLVGEPNDFCLLELHSSNSLFCYFPLLGQGRSCYWTFCQQVFVAIRPVAFTPIIGTCPDHPNNADNKPVSHLAQRHQEAVLASGATTPRGVRAANRMATNAKAGISPKRCPCSEGILNAWTAMIPARTRLDQTVNQIRLRCCKGFRDAMRRNTPSVAYTPRIICSYSGWLGCHRQPDGHKDIISGYTPKMKIKPVRIRAYRRKRTRELWPMCASWEWVMRSREMNGECSPELRRSPSRCNGLDAGQRNSSNTGLKPSAYKSRTQPVGLHARQTRRNNSSSFKASWAEPERAAAQQVSCSMQADCSAELARKSAAQVLA